ncbi:DUF416 family protein [Pseudoxanthomonas wuyuanensis]
MDYLDPSKLRCLLRSLPGWKRVVFMAECCERMLPNYREFSLETGVGDIERLREALSAVWNWIETDKLPTNISELIAECDQQAPDTSEFSSVYTSAALDAANSIAVTLEALSEATEERAIEVASLARDTVDLFVQQRSDLDPNSPELERQILEHPLMQNELQSQRQCLEKLQDQTKERRLLAAAMRSKFSSLKSGSLPKA